MVTKPQSYPEKIQALKTQVTQLQEELNEEKQKHSFVEEMQNEIAYLREQLDSKSKEDRSSLVSSKATMNDVLQRAESAEQGVKNLSAQNIQLQQQVGQLESALDLLGKEKFKADDLQRKNDALLAELQTANARHVTSSQRAQDEFTRLETENSNLMNALMRTRKLHDELSKKYQELVIAIIEAPNPLSQLKERLGD